MEGTFLVCWLKPKENTWAENGELDGPILGIIWGLGRLKPEL